MLFHVYTSVEFGVGTILLLKVKEEGHGVLDYSFKPSSQSAERFNDLHILVNIEIFISSFPCSNL